MFSVPDECYCCFEFQNMMTAGMKKPLSAHSRVRFRLRVPQIIIQKTIEIQGKIAARCTKKRRKTRRSWLPLILPDFEQIAERTSLAAKH